MSQNIVVIGAGVIGLSSAVALQDAGHSVTIVAKDFPGPFETIDPKTQINYTSPWGGAHNRWVPPAGKEQDSRDHRLSLQTFRRMDELARSYPEAGITFLKGIEYLESPPPEYAELTEQKAKELGLVEFRLLKKEELPAKVKWGCEYKTWTVNPMVYCPFLLRLFSIRGGKIVKREVREPTEIFGAKDLGSPAVVVNCSGIGFGDRDVFVTRGQTVVVSNHCEDTVTRQNADGTWTFSVPRNFGGGTVIGGTKEVDDWSTEPSDSTREQLLRKFAATYPKILDKSGKLTVIKDIVGRRPTRRGGARLETEQVAGGKAVIHAYGLGGRGYELSWGVANTVTELVSKQTGNVVSKL